MNLLAAKLYDPAVAVSKVTTAALAMTAIDTANLRLAVTVPAHGMVRFRLSAVIHGATTFPSILLGVMVGATVKGRVAPAQVLGNTAVATALLQVLAEFTVTGLTAGATNFDAAYGVETLVGGTGLKYGGPDNATANDAFGAFVFEAWDPQPITANNQIAVDASGRVDVAKVAGTAQTAGDIIARLPAALVGGRMDSSVGAMAANVLTAAAINAAALNGKGDWNIGKTGYALSVAGVQAIWDALTSALTTGGSIGKLFVDNINATMSSRATQTSLDVVDDLLDTEIATLLATTATILAAVDTEVAAIKARTDLLPAVPAAAGDAMSLTLLERAAVVDKLLGRSRAGGADGGRTVAQCLAFGRNRWTIVAGLLTVYADDGVTPLYTAMVTTASSDPVTSVTPS